MPGRAALLDCLLKHAFRLHFSDPDELALVAVGGYGRGELHPYSDIDVLLLVDAGAMERLSEPLERFVLFLWDLGLEIGHSVRTVEDCVQEAAKDITVATNLMESRLLAGTEGLYLAMRTATGPDRLWPSREFFEAKWQEQIERHRKFHDTAYNLEPNVKEGPGGLRDIQMIGWVAKRHFGVRTLADLVAHGFLTAGEYEHLITGQNFLWKVRFGLHVLAGRREDRLVFDHQRSLARMFGYQDDGIRLMVEHFMKDYYRTVMELGQLNELLLQLFQEELLYAEEPAEIRPINKRFRCHKGFVEVSHPKVFARYPFALLEVFLLLAEYPELKGVRANTIRLIRHHIAHIDERFRSDLRCRSLFMEILRQPHGITTALRAMNRFGVLGAYLPVFGRIVAQMQHDLFHVYTVDQHTLFVVQNLRRFIKPEFMHEFPRCTRIMRSIPKQEVLFIAALFHDIAKGRGGDHSELGAADVLQFCTDHQLSEYDAALAQWLVRNHLLMSVTAQRKDISDPEVVNQFAAAVGSLTYLDHLYALTVADIRATSPNLWNSWKDALLAELYESTRRALRRGLSNPMDENELRRETQEEVRRLLRDASLAPVHVDAFWARLGIDYFGRYSADEIAWHTQAVCTEGDQVPLILIRQETQRGGTEIFIYTQLSDLLFAVVTTALDQMRLNIVDARIMPSSDGYTLDTYIVLEENGTPIEDPRRIKEIQTRLSRLIRDPRAASLTVQRHMKRQLKHFTIPPQVTFQDDSNNGRTIMEVVTSDRPGILSKIGQALMLCGVRLQNAKIATLGARVEDVFFITDKHNEPLSDPEQMDCLRSRIIEMLEGKG
ncbi:MAG: [protein-PII] uridylyltransferase [Gammaproteobacteria bacterium]|nr:[protein-PII] uridylyltransferase [Gammaproteobacteria bacterium]